MGWADPRHTGGSQGRSARRGSRGHRAALPRDAQPGWGRSPSGRGDIPGGRARPGRVPCRAVPGEPPCAPRAAGPGSRDGPAGGARGAGRDARGTRGQRRGRGGRLRPGRSGVPVLTFCGAPGACPSCRPPRTAWAAACGPAGPALPGEENSREPA